MEKKRRAAIRRRQMSESNQLIGRVPMIPAVPPTAAASVSKPRKDTRCVRDRGGRDSWGPQPATVDLST